MKSPIHGWRTRTVFALALAAFVVAASGVLAWEEREAESDADYGEALSALRGHDRRNVVELGAAALFFEINSTDEDAGLHLFLDGVAWKNMQVFNPRGRRILEFTAEGEMRDLGVTELRFESAEPDAETALKLFRDGTYVFLGRTIDGKRLVGEAELSHEIADAPVFTPEDGAVVAPDDVVVEWQPIDGVETYQVIVESDAVEGALDVILPSSRTRLRIPEGFLEEGTEYKIEVLAKLANGNQTLTENVITTSGKAVDGVRPRSEPDANARGAVRVRDIRPLPSSGPTAIRFTLADEGAALVQVHDVQGRLVKTLVDGPMAAGDHEARWDGLDGGGTSVGPGVYFLTVRTHRGVERRRIVMTR